MKGQENNGKTESGRLDSLTLLFSLRAVSGHSCHEAITPDVVEQCRALVQQYVAKGALRLRPCCSASGNGSLEELKSLHAQRLS